ncbi:MAG: FIST N-terminal domain-containing protein [Polyangiaceae bacterium]
MNPNAPGSALPSAVFIDTIDASRLRDALRELRRSETFAGMLALVAEQDRACVAMLQRECGELGVSLVGGLFPALIHRTSLAVHGVWLIPLHHEMRYELIEQVEPDVDAAAATCAEAIDRMQLKERASLHLLVDATLQRIASLLESLFRELGDSVRYSGACAGCETFVRAPCVFDSTRFVENAVLALVLPDSVSAFAHGYTAPDDEGTATASSGNRIRASTGHLPRSMCTERSCTAYSVSSWTQKTSMHTRCIFRSGS